MLNPRSIAPARRAGPVLLGNRRLALPAVLALLWMLGTSAHATPFDELNAAERHELADRCLPLEHGPADADVLAMRACLVDALAATQADLSFDERYALDRLCGTDTDCEARERRALEGLDRPPLQALPADERDMVLRHCQATQELDGPVAWIGCLTDAVAELRLGPALERQTLTLDTRRAALFTCADRDPGRYRACLQQAGVPIDVTAIEPAAVAASPTDASASADSVSSSAPEGSGGEEAPAAERQDDLQARLRDSLENLDDSGRLVLLAAALLPILLLLSRWLMRRRQPDDGAAFADSGYAGDGYSSPTDRARFDQDRMADDGFDSAPGDERQRFATGFEKPYAPDDVLLAQADAAAADAAAAAERSRFDRQADRLFEDLDTALTSAPDTHRPTPPVREPEPEPEPAPATPREPVQAAAPTSDPAEPRRESHPEAPTRLVGRPTAGVSDSPDAVPPAADPDATAPPPARTSLAVPRSDFGRWLAEQPDEDRLTDVLEFLVYWMAYGDRRYDEQVRRELLDNEVADGAQAIKRWVLLEDTGAFFDALHWMRSNASPEQCAQTLQLLIALLVTDAAPTPVQNTLLRFLSDVFGSGAAGLEELWRESFDAPLPALPRVDRADWWALQDEQAIAERDARDVASYPAELQHAALLGLPLRGPLEPAQIRAACRRAIQRSEPERFNVLGERARQLAARQLERVELARDALLEQSNA